MPRRTSRATDRPKPVWSAQQYLEYYRNKLDAARNVSITILVEVTEKSVEVGGEFDRLQREAEQLAIPLVIARPANQTTPEIDAITTRWIQFLKTNQMQAVLHARDELLKASIYVFETFSRNGDSENLLKMLAKVCRQFGLVSPPTSALAPDNLARKIYSKSTIAWVTFYHENAAHPSNWETSKLHRIELLYSLSKTGSSLVEAVLLLRGFTETLSIPSNRRLISATNLRTTDLISNDERNAILKVCAYFGTLIGLKKARNVEYEMVLEGFGPALSLSHRQLFNYFPTSRRRLSIM